MRRQKIISSRKNRCNHISVHSIGNPTCEINRKISEVCKNCIAYNTEKERPQLLKKLLNNARYLSTVDIDVSINSRRIQFNVFGEILNYQHLKNIMNICTTNQSTQFLLITTRIDLVQNIDKPKNLILVYKYPYLGFKLGDIPKVFDKTIITVDANVPHITENELFSPKETILLQTLNINKYV